MSSTKERCWLSCIINKVRCSIKFIRFWVVPACLLFMQGNFSTNLLRNSYGFQKTDIPILRSPNTKGFPMPRDNPTHPHDNTNNIRQQEAKLEGFEGLMKKKHANDTFPQAPSKPQAVQAKGRSHFPMPQGQQLGQDILRGSCQNILKKFDYHNLRNTTHFNPIQKRNTQHQIRRSPQEEHHHLNMNKTYTAEYTPTFLKADKQECHNSYVSPSRTPPKQDTANHGREGRTPTKYKTLAEAKTSGVSDAKTSGMSKTSPQTNDSKKFKSLNEIIELKNKQKLAENAKNYKRSRIINGFQLGRSLGKGKFGEVFLARHHETGFLAAIKRIEKKKVGEYKMVDQFTKEIRLHSCLDHPNIVKFFGVFEDRDFVYLVMEYMNGGTLFDYLNEVPYLQTSVATTFLKDVIEALAYMHDKSIAHRDIKPENIVINSEGVAKLCDFGWSALVETSRKTYCGTFDYAPPEILERKNYDTSVDIWCIGVLTYELLTGRVPFEGEKRNEVMQKIVNVDKNKIDYPVNIPVQAKEFIEALVQKDPSLRPRCQDLLKYRLFSQFLPKQNKSKKMA